MKIAFFEPPAAQKIGGLETAIQGLKKALERSGHEVAINADVEADVVHFHGLWQPSFLKIARRCRSEKVPYVASPHGMLEPWAWKHKRWKKIPYYFLFEKQFLAQASALFATATSEAKNLGRFFPRQKIFTVPLGITEEAFPDYEGARHLLGWKQDERVLLFLSRIHPKKGLDLLLRALPRFEGKYRLIVVGDGDADYIDELKKSANAQVEWIGGIWNEERWKYFQGADLFCLPSHSENFGLAVLEACQVGTPVLTTVTTPWADFLKHQIAYICKPELESIAEALKRFEAAPVFTTEARIDLAAWTKEQFNWEALAESYIAAYKSLF